MLDSLRWLPTSRFTLITSSLILISKHSLLLHNQKVWIILSICICKLRFLNSIRRRIENYLFIRKYTSRNILLLKLHLKCLIHLRLLHHKLLLRHINHKRNLLYELMTCHLSLNKISWTKHPKVIRLLTHHL